jgi:hypothetical protein
MRRRGFLAAAILLFVAACVARPHGLRPEPPVGAGLRDVHQRLSLAIARDGFEHGMRTRVQGQREIDSIYIRIPFDSLRRRHPGLEKLMRDIGAIFHQPEFSTMPIRIDIGAGDAGDREYLRQALLAALAGAGSVEVGLEASDHNDIVITVVHRRLGEP